MSGATQLCPECGSPLRPCKCERDEYLSPPGAVRNSTLGVRKGSGLKRSGRLRRRSLKEKFGDDPLRYGPVLEDVREQPCAGRRWLPGHECGPGYAPASAHHLGDDDLDGLIPACGRLHDRLELEPAAVDADLADAGSPDLEALGRRYVLRAAERLEDSGELPPEVSRGIDAGRGRA